MEAITHWNQRSFYIICALNVLIMVMDSKATVIPVCPPPGNSPTTSPDASFCQCSQGNMRSGSTISIMCNFKNQEDVKLTSDLYPFETGNLVQAQVRVRNATGVRVTEGFLGSLQSVPSASLDVWRGGQLILESTPPLKKTFPPSYTTYLGIGIINCSLNSIPKRLFRDRTVGGLLIRGSSVGTISKEMLYNVYKMKYLKIENSSVGIVEGPISKGGSVSLVPSSNPGNKWQGFVISQSYFHNIASGAISVVNQESSKTRWKVTESRIEQVETEAITVRGKVDVSFEGNYFRTMNSYALVVNTSGSTVFEENHIENLEPEGLKRFQCGNGDKSLNKNTIHMESRHDQPYNSSTAPFHPSCGKVQVFVVMSPPQPQTLQQTSNATWILLAIILVIVIVIAGVGLFLYRNQALILQYRRGETPYTMGLERTSMQQLRDSNEPDTEEEEDNTDTGLTNPVYGIKEPS